MQDYDGPSSSYHPLIGAGAWPDHYVNMVFLLILIAVLIGWYIAFRAGQRAGARDHEGRRSRAPEIIFVEVRRKIDNALFATGEKAFGPVKTLVDTIDAYLGPVLALAAGPGSLIGATGRLKSALNTTKKKVVAESHGPGPSSVIIAAGGNGSAIASAAADGGSVQVVHPARIIEVPAGGHGEHGHEKEVEMTSAERARAVRDALEQLSDTWQRERVIRELSCAQQALLIAKPIGPPSVAAATLAPPPRELRPAPPRPEQRPRRALF